MSEEKKTIKLRVRPGKTSRDARPFEFILGRVVGCQFVELTITPAQIATLRASDVFEFLGDPPPRRVVRLIGRDVDVTGRRRVVLTGGG